MIMAKGPWGEGTLQHGSREVRQRSGVFILDANDRVAFVSECRHIKSSGMS